MALFRLRMPVLPLANPSLPRTSSLLRWFFAINQAYRVVVALNLWILLMMEEILMDLRLPNWSRRLVQMLAPS